MYQIGFIRKTTFIFSLLCIIYVFQMFWGIFLQSVYFFCFLRWQTIPRMCFNLCHFMPCCVCLFVFPFLHFISSQFLAIFSRCLHVIHLSAALVNTLNLFINLCVLFSIYFVGLPPSSSFSSPLHFLPVVLFPSRCCHFTSLRTAKIRQKVVNPMRTTE